MRKKIFVLLFALVVVSLVGCGKENTEATTDKDKTIETDTEVEEALDVVAGVVEAEDLDWESAEENNFSEEDIENSVVTEVGVTEKQEKAETPTNKDNVVDGQEPEKENSEKAPAAEKENITTDTSTNTTTNTDTTEDAAKQESSEKENSDKAEESFDKENSDKAEVSYEEFLELSAAEQQKYMETFADIESFFVWYNQAKSEYEKEHPPIILDGDKNNVEDFLGGE